MSFTVQMWHWLVDEKLVGSKECHDLRPSLTRHLTSTWGKDKQSCETPSKPSRWRMISAKVVQYRTLWDMFKFLHMKYQGQTQASMSTCNKQQIQNSNTHIFTHLHTSSHIFTHLHTLEMAASPFGMSANLRPSLGESSPGNLKYSGVMYPIAANMEILQRQW